jgi:hypothetical protein
MNLLNKINAAKGALMAAALFGATTVMAQGFSQNPSQINGPTAGQISSNVAASLGGISKGFEAFLYLMGVVFMVVFVLTIWKWKKSDGRDGNIGLICVALILSVVCFAAPTFMGSAKTTLLGTGATTGVQAPSSTPNFN